MRIVVEFFGQCGAYGNTHSLAKRTTCHANARQVLVRGGMPLQPAVDLTECAEFLHGEIAAAGQGTVIYRGDMPIAQEEEVFADPVHLEIGIVLHYVEVQGCEILRATQRPAGVPALNGMYHAYDIPAYLGGYVL